MTLIEIWFTMLLIMLCFIGLNQLFEESLNVLEFVVLLIGNIPLLIILVILKFIIDKLRNIAKRKMINELNIKRGYITQSDYLMYDINFKKESNTLLGEPLIALKVLTREPRRRIDGNNKS